MIETGEISMAQGCMKFMQGPGRYASQMRPRIGWFTLRVPSASPYL